MSAAPAFQFYPGDFMRSVMMWDAIAVGVYIQLLCIQWDHGGIPDDLDLLEKAVGKEVREVWPLVGTKFARGKDGFLRNPRLERVRKEQNDYRERIGKARRKAAAARWEIQSKRISNSSASADASADASAMLYIEGEGEGEGEDKKNSGKERARATVEDRRANFVAACKEITDADPDRLAKAERKGFLDYWTESSKSGRMRFEAEKFFNHGRRMDTWMANARRRANPTATARLRPELTAERTDLKTTFD